MDIQTLTVVITGIGVLIAAVNQIFTSREANRHRLTEIETRQAELFMQVYSQWSSKEFQKAYGLVRAVYQWDTPEEWVEKYYPDKNIEAYGDFRILTTFMNGLGVLVKKELIDIELVEELLGGRILWFWDIMLPAATHFREALQDPLLYQGIEYLGTVLKERYANP